ncbi:hypothetical protein EDD16DRAFT_1528586 [Pisolithus croceorrhizus]|nr:hypothetical protein EDD16DRAFT_1528586 [Pisolithus croceorrhizus]KAI6098731.1 hypothetical protein F5141DRAFT_1066791 [Pisolithus sp. B1]KAI6105185.1 hypothetical protein EV401DRAFT_1892944 [Pisolithus croceorrhizus]
MLGRGCKAGAKKEGQTQQREKGGGRVGGQPVKDGLWVQRDQQVEGRGACIHELDHGDSLGGKLLRQRAQAEQLTSELRKSFWVVQGCHQPGGRARDHNSTIWGAFNDGEGGVRNPKLLPELGYRVGGVWVGGLNGWGEWLVGSGFLCWGQASPQLGLEGVYSSWVEVGLEKVEDCHDPVDHMGGTTITEYRDGGDLEGLALARAILCGPRPGRGVGCEVMQDKFGEDWGSKTGSEGALREGMILSANIRQLDGTGR